MSAPVLRPLAAAHVPLSLPAPPMPPGAARDGPRVLPAFRFVPSVSPLLEDTAVLAETYARAADRAKGPKPDPTDDPAT